MDFLIINDISTLQDQVSSINPATVYNFFLKKRPKIFEENLGRKIVINLIEVDAMENKIA